MGPPAPNSAGMLSRVHTLRGDARRSTTSAIKFFLGSNDLLFHGSCHCLVGFDATSMAQGFQGSGAGI